MYGPAGNDGRSGPAWLDIIHQSFRVRGVSRKSLCLHEKSDRGKRRSRWLARSFRQRRTWSGKQVRPGSSSCSPSAKTTRRFSRASIPLLPLRSDVVFPQTVVPLVINRPSGIRLIDDCMIGERMVGLVSQLHPETDSPGMDDLYPDRLRGLDPQDAQVSRRLDADRLPGAVSGAAGGRDADRAVPDRPDRAVRGGRRGRSRARRPGASREPVLSADGRPEPADPRRAAGRGDQHAGAGAAGRPAGLEPAVHDRGEAEPAGRDQRAGPARAAGAISSRGSSRSSSSRPRSRSRSAAS